MKLRAQKDKKLTLPFNLDAPEEELQAKYDRNFSMYMNQLTQLENNDSKNNLEKNFQTPNVINKTSL